MLPDFTGATMDSRLVKPGMLFVAIKGEHVDGHDFIASALEKGAAGIVDGREELASVAREYRKTLKAKVIGITGSAGKTTTKELVARVLATGGKAHATCGNFNNDLGLPLTILNCPKDADYLVLEMGTNHPGEIKYLVDIARPDCGIISSIGTAHIEFFRTQDGIADEKGTLFRSLPANGFAVVSRENERYERLVAMAAARLVTASLAGAKADFSGRVLDASTGSFETSDGNGRIVVTTDLPGAHNCSNAMLAYACGVTLGISPQDCAKALSHVELPGYRWRKTEANGISFINDAYNANPTSMIAALETFASARGEGRNIAVIGDMRELGDMSEELHRKVGKRARELAINDFLLIGEMSSKWIGAELAELPCARNVVTSRSVEEAKTFFRRMIHSGDRVLLKASRGMALERLLEGIAEK